MPLSPEYSHELCAEKLRAAEMILLLRLKDSGVNFSAVLNRRGEYGPEELGSNKWLTSVHQYPPEPADPEVYTLHVFRSNWFNEDRQGIHFETFMGPKEWKKKQIQMAMHIFHVENIPGTSIKRRAVAVPFVDEVYERVSKWDGYKFRTGKYGAHPFTRLLSFEYETFEAKLSAELLRLCLELGPVMDKTLERVLGAPE